MPPETTPPNIQTIQRRPLGDTGMKVFPISLGCVKFGRNQSLKYPEQFELPTQASLAVLLDLAAELGINLLDTAPAYGESETRIGEWLNQQGALSKNSQREKWLLSTKVGEYFSDGQSSYDFTADRTRRSIEESLTRLGTDYLDIVFVHSNGDDEAIIQHSPVLEVLHKAKQDGQIRAIGFSGKTVKGSLLAVDLVDVFMVTLNSADQSQTPLIDACREKSKGVLIKKALASGHATDPTRSLQFALDYPGVTSVITGTINPEHLAGNVAGVK